jgi:hypothetical protein
MDNFEGACTQLDDFLGNTTRSTVDPDALHLYVCTHGARACRCGEWGSKVADALRNEISKRKGSEPTGTYSCIVVREVGHVGGRPTSELVFQTCFAAQLEPYSLPLS